MRMTLLEITQGILSSLDSDEVNSIGDTTESLQVANLVKTVYNDVISRANLPEHFDFVELNASGDPGKPTVMYRPTGLQNLLWIKYDKRMLGDTESSFQLVQFLEPKLFSDQYLTYKNQNQGDVVTYFIDTANSSSIEITSLKTKAPDYWTCFDDHTIIFDSFDFEVDTTLMKNKTMVYAEMEPSFLMEDSFVPDLDSRQFSLLFNEAKALAFAELKQTEHALAQRNAKRGWTTLAHQKDAMPANYPYFKTLPNYGRK